jgi:hypothetical protein
VSAERPSARGAAGALLVCLAALPDAAFAQPCGTSEWLCHKSADGLHPDGVEQALVWMMNRARQDPPAEGSFLANVDDPDVEDALDAYDVNLALLQDEFDAVAVRPPAAFDRRLHAAARAHAQLMIDTDSDNPPCGTSGLPPCQLERVFPAGFYFSTGGLRGNAYGFALSPLFAHAAWNVDWGIGAGGVDPQRTHRKGLMSIPDASTTQVLTNVGIAAVPTDGLPTGLGPLVVVANYANAQSVSDHFDRFLVGTVWEDLDADGSYDAGEGKGGVTVTPTPGNWIATTAPGGGYAIPVITPGAVSVEVAFSGGGVRTYRTMVQVPPLTSVLVDYPVPEPSALGSGFAAALGLRGARSLKREARGRAGPRS